MRICIAGGAGFIGSHLCDYALAHGHDVVCVDNFITGNRKNIAHLVGNEHFRVIEHDVTMPLSIDGNLDAILHFASPASPPDYLAHPFETLMVGSFATHHLCELAHRKNAVFFLASTSEVYGDPLQHPQQETYWGNVNSVGPRSVYDEAKRYAEAVTMAYHRYHHLSTRIVRIFNTYGERMRPNDGRAIPNFMCQALNNEPITVFGDGSQTRSFCYVSDLVEGIYKLLLSNESSPVNLGNPNEMTLKQLAEMIKKLTCSTSKIVYKPLPTDDPKVRKPDITKAKQLLQWEPRIVLDEGLKKTIAWFKTQHTSTTVNEPRAAYEAESPSSEKNIQGEQNAPVSPPNDTTPKDDAFYERKYTERVKKMVLALLHDYPCTVFLFGSRADGTSRRGSDFDIGVMGLEQSVFAEVRSDLLGWVEGSIVPYNIDFVNFDTVNEEFKKFAMRYIITWKTN